MEISIIEIASNEIILTNGETFSDIGGLRKNDIPENWYEIAP